MKKTGDTLKKIRINLDLSVEDVSKEIKIKISTLKDIEGGTFPSTDPGKYAALKRFVVSYAKFLNTNPDRLLEVLNKEYQESLPSPTEAPEATSDSLETQRAPKSPFITEGSFKNKYVLNALVIAFFVLGLFALFLVSSIIQKYELERSSQSYSHIVPLNHIDLTALEETRFSLVVDEGEMQHVEISPSIKSYTFRKNVKLTFENAGAIKISLNGLDLGMAGPYGKKQSREFPMKNTKPTKSSKKNTKPTKSSKKNTKPTKSSK